MWTRTKRLLRPLIPKFAMRMRAEFHERQATREFNRNSDRRFANRSPREVFTKIYQEKLWGKDAAETFYSGSGSHDELTVNTYVGAVRSFLAELPYKPNAVDLGCGDFNVGMRIRSLCDRYVACDVVSALIERNKEVHRGLDVDFRCLDMCSEKLPRGDVVFIRQVFQHLSNAQILSVIPKLSAYKVLILTEGLPAAEGFVPNADKPIGDGIRFQRKVSSGVVLSSPPFNLPHSSEVVLCEVPCGPAVIRTTAYHLR